MAQLREIKKRIKAVGNIQRITRTMQMIATAKFQSSVKRAEATKPYTAKLGEITAELADAASGDHPLLTRPAESTGRELMLVLSSNRGLCGAYNSNILRTAINFIRDHEQTRFDIEAVGKKGLAYLRFNGIDVAESYTHFTDKPAYADVEQLAADYMDRFLAGQYDAVRICYMRFISNSRQEPNVLTLLPMERPEGESAQQPPAQQGTENQPTSEQRGETGGGGGGGYNSIYEFSPDPATLLDELLPLTVKARLFQCFNDAVVSEQLSRMVAMKAATDNAAKMRRNLKRDFNQARQAQITTELSEIISGAAALG